MYIFKSLVIDIVSRVLATYNSNQVEEISLQNNIVILTTKLTNASNKTPYSSVHALPASKNICFKSIEFGEYYFVNIPSISLFEWHPFSVSEQVSVNEIRFHIKSMGGSNTWTGKLAQKVLNNDITNLKVALDGPYGSLSINIALYKHITILVGGIGITPMMPILSSIKKMGRAGYDHLNLVELIWSVRDIETIKTFENQLFEIFDLNSNKNIEQIKSKSKTPSKSSKSTQQVAVQDVNKYNMSVSDLGMGIRMQIQVYLTSNKIEGSNDLETNNFIKTIPVKFSRLNIVEIVEQSAKRNILSSDSTYDPYGSCVLLCGPKGMSQEAANLAVKNQIHYHNEIFNY